MIATCFVLLAGSDSAGGRYEPMTPDGSDDSHPAPGDTNRINDVFVHDRDQTCGNGVRDNDEQCDDGNLVDGDGCSETQRG